MKLRFLLKEMMKFAEKCKLKQRKMKPHNLKSHFMGVL